MEGSGGGAVRKVGRESNRAGVTAHNRFGTLAVVTIVRDNARAIALYRKHGFVEEGTSRAHALRDGVYVDSLLMGRLHPRPPQLTAAAGGASRSAMTVASARPSSRRR